MPLYYFMLFRLNIHQLRSVYPQIVNPPFIKLKEKTGDFTVVYVPYANYQDLIKLSAYLKAKCQNNPITAPTPIGSNFL